MKKVLSLLAVLTVTVFMASSVWAADTLPDVQKAYASFSDSGVSVSFDLYLHQDGKAYTFTGEENANYTSTTANIQFDVSTVTPGRTDFTTNPDFAKGTVFARVQTNLAQKKSGTTLLMYTKNTTDDNGDYRVKYDDNTKVLGLIRSRNTSEVAVGDNAPIEMQFFARSAAPTTYPTTMTINASGGNEKYLEDQGSNTYSTTTAKIGQSGENGGVWGGTNQYGDWYGSDMIIFFGAWFKTVFDGDEFGTESINIVTYVQ